MVAKVILNPYAGRWKALERRSDVELALRDAGLDFDLVLTERPGHGTELAKEAVETGFSPVIAAGGDGTINEVVNGLMLALSTNGAQTTVPFGVMPLGSANDLVVNLGLPQDFGEMARVIAAGKTKRMDLGLVNGFYFANNSAIGLEPTITLIQQRIKWLKGIFRYLLATLIGINQNPRWDSRIEWDGGSYEGLISLVTVGISPLTGGLFYMTPHADPFDGKLTFVYGYLPTRLKILSTLPRTMRPGAGNYVENPAIHEVNTEWLKVITVQPTPLHTDGEIRTVDAYNLDYKVAQGVLTMLIC
jgi:diacylglycerol kinase (ATP)